MGASPSHQENDEKDRIISIANSFTTDSNPRDLIISPQPLYQSLTLLVASIGDIEVNKLLNRKGFCIYIRGKPTTNAITSQATSSISTLEVLGYAIVNEITISDDLINNWKQGIDIISTSIQNPIILAFSEFVILPQHREKGFARKFINLIKQKYTTSSNGVIGLWPVAPRENELEFARTVILEDEGGAFIAWFYLTQCGGKIGVEEKEEEEEEGRRGGEAKDEDDDEEEDVIREKQDMELYISYQDFKNCKDLKTVKSQIGKIAKEKDLNIQILCHKYADFLSSKFTGSISTDKEEEEGGGGGGLGFQREYAEAVALLTINDLFREDDDEKDKDKGKEEIETRNRSTHELENSNLTTTTTTTTTISSNSSSSAAIGSKRSLEITEISSSLSEQMTSSNKRVKENKEEDVEENLG
jgi:hypothetical protein